MIEEPYGSTQLTEAKQLDYREIAKMYGQGAIYSTMKHKLRVYREKAEQLRAEAADGGATTNYSPSGPQGSRTPKSRSNKSTPAKTRTSSKKGSSAGDNPESTQGVCPSPNDEVVLIDDDEVSPIKPEIKRDNEETRELLGIKRHPRDIEHSDDTVAPKRQRKSTVGLAEIPETFPLENRPSEPRVDSHRNGYVIDLSQTETVVRPRNVDPATTTAMRLNMALKENFMTDAMFLKEA